MKSIRQNSLNMFIEWPITFYWASKPGRILSQVLK